jgi:hypothetical protein
MPKILAVHGVGQQFKGDAIIHREWWPALLSGLHLAGSKFSESNEFVCAFYGHLFRNPSSLATSNNYNLSNLDSDELALLKELWETASSYEPESVPSFKDFENQSNLGYSSIPNFAQRALNALSKSKFFVNIAQNLLLGDLKQLSSYLKNPQVNKAVINTVLDLITDDVRVVIGHSLGSVVAYEALCLKPANVVSFITLGSPLGIKNLVFDKLTPRPNTEGIGFHPQVKSWTNIADKGDIVALQKNLAPQFGSGVKDILVNNGSDAHHGERYLSTVEVGEIVNDAL